MLPLSCWHPFPAHIHQQGAFQRLVIPVRCWIDRQQHVVFKIYIGDNIYHPADFFSRLYVPFQDYEQVNIRIFCGFIPCPGAVKNNLYQSLAVKPFQCGPEFLR